MNGLPTNDTSESWDATFERLYFEHYARVAGLLVRMTSCRAEAEALANEVFWKLYRQRSAIQPDGNVGGWLYRTATHLGIDALRKNSRRRQWEDQAARAAAVSAAPHGPLDEVLREEQRRSIHRVLARLKPVHAQALVLRSTGFSYREVAEALGVKRVSVGTLLLRAEASFRKHYRTVVGAKEDV